ncbi:hypothetical protein COCCADRAFT_99260, partial [Bipolaris zeicola 26-R-13]
HPHSGLRGRRCEHPHRTAYHGPCIFISFVMTFIPRKDFCICTYATMSTPDPWISHIQACHHHNTRFFSLTEQRISLSLQ